MIYLDNAATTFPKPEAVYETMDKANRTLAVNAGRGAYAAAKEATHLIGETKEQLLVLFHAKGIADIVFTPSVTHAMNQILSGLNLKEGDTVFVSPYEHNAVARTLHMLQKKAKFNIRLLPLQQDLQIDIEKTAFLFAETAPTAVVMTAVSNVTGYVTPVKEVFELAKKAGAVTVMDAAQAAGLLDIDMRYCNADIVCFAGHKTLYGPFGIGGFAIKKGISLEVVFAGGTGSNSLNLDMPLQAPERYEASSPNIVAIAGLNAALKTVTQSEHYAHITQLTQYLIEKLGRVEKVKMLGTYDTVKTMGIVSFIVDGYNSDDVGAILDDEFDVAVRTGFHCAPFIHEYLSGTSNMGTVRASIGIFTSRPDIDVMVNGLSTL